MFQELGELGLLYYNCLFVCLPTMLIALVMGEHKAVISAFLHILLQLSVILTDIKLIFTYIKISAAV